MLAPGKRHSLMAGFDHAGRNPACRQAMALAGAGEGACGWADNLQQPLAPPTVRAWSADKHLTHLDHFLPA